MSANKISPISNLDVDYSNPIEDQEHSGSNCESNTKSYSEPLNLNNIPNHTLENNNSPSSIPSGNKDPVTPSSYSLNKESLLSDIKDEKIIGNSDYPHKLYQKNPYYDDVEVETKYEDIKREPKLEFKAEVKSEVKNEDIKPTINPEETITITSSSDTSHDDVIFIEQIKRVSADENIISILSTDEENNSLQNPENNSFQNPENNSLKSPQNDLMHEQTHPFLGLFDVEMSPPKYILKGNKKKKFVKKRGKHSPHSIPEVFCEKYSHLKSSLRKENGPNSSMIKKRVQFKLIGNKKYIPYKCKPKKTKMPLELSLCPKVCRDLRVNRCFYTRKTKSIFTHRYVNDEINTSVSDHTLLLPNNQAERLKLAIKPKDCIYPERKKIAARKMTITSVFSVNFQDDNLLYNDHVQFPNSYSPKPHVPGANNHITQSVVCPTRPFSFEDFVSHHQLDHAIMDSQLSPSTIDLEISDIVNSSPRHLPLVGPSNEDIPNFSSDEDDDDSSISNNQLKPFIDEASYDSSQNEVITSNDMDNEPSDRNPPHYQDLISNSIVPLSSTASFDHCPTNSNILSYPQTPSKSQLSHPNQDTPPRNIDQAQFQITSSSPAPKNQISDKSTNSDSNDKSSKSDSNDDILLTPPPRNDPSPLSFTPVKEPNIQSANYVKPDPPTPRTDEDSNINDVEAILATNSSVSFSDLFPQSSIRFARKKRSNGLIKTPEHIEDESTECINPLLGEDFYNKEPWVAKTAFQFHPSEFQQLIEIMGPTASHIMDHFAEWPSYLYPSNPSDRKNWTIIKNGIEYVSISKAYRFPIHFINKDTKLEICPICKKIITHKYAVINNYIVWKSNFNGQDLLNWQDKNKIKRACYIHWRSLSATSTRDRNPFTMKTFRSNDQPTTFSTSRPQAPLGPAVLPLDFL